jgi:hypothetical protein
MSENNSVKAIALNKKGQFTNIEYARPCKVLKNAPAILKTTKAFNVRVGAEYDALKTTLEAKGVANKEEAHKVNQGLFGMEWVSYPVVLKSVKSGKEYIRLETAKNTRFETVYTVNGKEVAKAEIEQYLQASEKKSGDLPTVMNIGVENIHYIK